MLIPLPALIVDLLLAFSITASVLVLLVAIQILKPVQFSVFPSLVAAADIVPTLARPGQQPPHPAARK